MVDDLRIKVTADTSSFKKGMKKARDEIDKTEKKSEESGKKTGFGKLRQALSEISPGFKSLSDGWDDSMDTMQKDGKKGFGLMKAAGLLSIAGLAGQGLQMITQMAQQAFSQIADLAKLGDPVRYEKSMARMQKATKTLKTSLSALASPIFEWLSKAVEKVAGLINGLVETIMKVVGFVQGLFGLGGQLNSTLSATADGMTEATEAADAGLASFDKLNTLDTGEMGDAEQMARMDEILQDARKAGADLAETLGSIFDIDFGGLWDGFTETAGQAWDWLTAKAGAVWEGIKSTVLGLWNGFVEWATAAWNKMKELALAIWNAIVTTVTALWTRFVELFTAAWNALKEFALSVWNTITETVTNLWNKFVELFTAAWNALKELALSIWETITETVTDLWNKFVELFTEAWNALKEFALSIWNTITGVVTDLWNKFYDTAVRIWNAIKGFVTGVWDTITSGILGAFEKVGNTIRSIFDTVWNAIKSAFNIVYSAIAKGFNFAIRVVNGLIRAFNSVMGILSLGSVQIGLLSEIPTSLNGFAEGGVIAPNDPHAVIVGDNRREQEIISPLSTMKQAFKEAMMEMGAGGGSLGQGGVVRIENVVKLDGREVARSTYDYLMAESRRRGMTI